MQTVRAKDARIPALGIGTWQLRGRECADRVIDALHMGYRHVDTAQMYENHDAVGMGIRVSRVQRDEVFITTKLWMENLRRDAVHESTEESLRDLGTDYVDLLLVHWPNESVPLEETLEAMLELKERNCVRHIGVSNFPPSKVEAASAIAPVVCDQVEYHPLLTQSNLLGPLRQRDMALIAYSPLAHGDVAKEPVLQEIAEAHGRSPAQVSLRWLLSQESVAAIPKASSRVHLEENLQIFDFELEPDEVRRIHALADERRERKVDPAFAPFWE